MIRVRGHLRCMTADEAAAVAAHVADHIALSRAEPGCLSFHIVATDDPIVWALDETFRDRPAFDAHQARTRDSAWFAATRSVLRDLRIEDLPD
ncbi:MAG TPA: antibiotic biosynthesis monooxygenase [Paracoccaceae bacterium]|nr:antibiotic biosynthesis monooxygenase [Paracoccaceae bacterium]